jgi:hypothetical protein
MRPFNETLWIRQLAGQDHDLQTIARMLDIDRNKVYSVLKETRIALGEITQRRNDVLILLEQLQEPSLQLASDYAYLLGIYLGDGCISRVRKVYRIRVALDSNYPNIITHCQQVIQRILPHNDVSLVPIENKGRICMYYVSCYYKDWPTLLPQHGTGMKHEREIILADWQQRIVETHALEFFRGLFHSDGSRFANIVNGKDYPRYQFSNCSRDIIDLFIAACERLNIHYTEKFFEKPGHALRYDVFISKRKDVAYLDSVVGPKA